MPDPDVTPERHVYGAPDAPVTLLEYGDLECPYCRSAAPVLRRVVDASEGQVRLVWRHFPLFEVHPYALTAALAVEAAGAQGRFWEMHAELFAHQDRLTDDGLRAAAARVGVDPDLVAGPAAQRFAPAVQRDYTDGIAVGVRSTPTVFVDGVLFAHRVRAESLRTAIEEALAARGAGRR